LPGWGLTKHADIVELIVSEPATNAIVHGNGPVEICLSRAPGHLQAGVGDHGAGQPALRHPAAEDMTGRGLALIDALTGSSGGSWGVTASTSGQPGKTVYASIPLAPEPDGGTQMHQHQATDPHDGTPGPALALLRVQARPHLSTAIVSIALARSAGDQGVRRTVHVTWPLLTSDGRAR
jgi:hypothetical protein